MPNRIEHDADLKALEIISNETPTRIVRRSFIATSAVLVVIIFTCWLIKYPDNIAANVVYSGERLGADINRADLKHLSPGGYVILKFDERSIETRVHSIDNTRVVFETSEHPISSHATIVTGELNLLQRCAERVTEMLTFRK